MLPENFLERIREMLGEEYPLFLQSYEEESCHALRINTLKCNREYFLKKAPFQLTEVPWSKAGYYYNKDDRPGRHPYHDAGVYYIQEASAMAPVEYLDPQPGERILDLCAAPGGKSTQIAAKMKQQGLLVCNEIHSARAKILSENMERMGVCNSIVTNETPQRLAQMWDGYFDRILVDAPCSGEGMFRKNPKAWEEWSTQQVQVCALRQEEVLSCGAKMVKPGGRMVYSTCTFAPEEDEGAVWNFLKEHPDFSLVCAKRYSGMEPGNPAWAGPYSDQDEEKADELSGTIRLWPHKIKGEGHFLAIMQKRGELEPAEQRGGALLKGIPEKNCREYLAFRKEHLKDMDIPGIYVMFGEQLYLAPEETMSLDGLKVLRPGLHLGTVKKNRFEPSHALALAMQTRQAVHVLDLPWDSPEILDYLKGLALNVQGEKGWYLIAVDGFGIGWGKLSKTTMKNHYPKGLRRM